MDTYKNEYENHEDIMYASVPQMDQLRGVICEIDFIDVQDSSTKSNFHWQTMKCRLLILLVPDVIASPVLGTERFITVIMTKEYFENGKLLNVLRHFKLIYKGTRPVTTEVYQACLAYTIQCKVAPVWNKVGKYYIQGRDFYNTIQSTGALSLEVLVDGEATRLQLRTDKIKVPFVKLEDCYLTETTIAEFLADPKGRITLSQQTTPYMHVLPSMKRGKVLSVSKEIPERCPFKDYEQLRRHWKNMYGYSLPKRKDGILYYEIKFPVPRSQVFTYPNVCLTTGPIEVIQTGSTGTTAMQFLLDMLTAVSQICGKNLELSKLNTFNTNTPIANMPSAPCQFRNNVKTFRNDSKRSEGNATKRVEFSNRYVDELIQGANRAPALSLKAPLSKIHQIHNTANATDRNTNSFFNTIENEQEASTSNIEQSHMNPPKRNSATREDETVSSHFKIRKLSHTIDGLKDEVVVEENQKTLRLKEKLERSKQSVYKKSLQKTVEDADIMEMAKNNELEKLSSAVLSNWLKRRSIPHKKSGKKSAMISTILSHIKNTQIFHNFRI